MPNKQKKEEEPSSFSWGFNPITLKFLGKKWGKGKVFPGERKN
jgi:hypothetical protein